MIIMRDLPVVILTWLLATGVFAQSDSPVITGAQLDIQRTCSLAKSWNDKGSGADLDGFFYLPVVDSSAYIIGGYGTQKKKLTAEDCVLAVGASARLVEPIAWELIWLDQGSGARLDGSMWRAIPPSEAYRCIGTVPQIDYEKPSLTNYRCVPAAFTEKVVTSTLIWTDQGSGAKKPVSIFKLPNSGSFVAVPGRMAQIEVVDLRLRPVVPDTAAANQVISPTETTPAADKVVPPAEAAPDNEIPDSGAEGGLVVEQPSIGANENVSDEGSAAQESVGRGDGLPTTGKQVPGLPLGATIKEVCAKKQTEIACWRELENQPGCFVMLPHSFGEQNSATWSGSCTDGLAVGIGTITITYVIDQEEHNHTATGQVQYGKPHGPWVIRRGFPFNSVWGGSYVDGMAQGQWVGRYEDGDVVKGPFVDDKLHGQIIVHSPDGSVVEINFVHGEVQE